MPIPKNFTVIDLETTGPISVENYVIEIGIVRVENGKIVKTLDTLIRPPVPVPSSITHLTGLRDEDLKDAPSFQNVASEVEGLFEDAVFTAHNAPFDYGFLSLEYLRLGKRFLKPLLCTKDLASVLLPGQIKLGLDALSELFEIEAPVRHRAFPDAEITAKVLLKLLEKEGASERLAKAVIFPDKRFFHLPEDSFFQGLPETSGIYRFLSKQGDVLYLGAGKNIALSAALHFVSQIEDKKERELCAKTHQIDFNGTPTGLEAEIEKAFEIQSERPKLNRLLKEWHPGAYLWVSKDPFPFLQIENEGSDCPEFSSFGPYSSRRHLEKLMEYVKGKFRLCDYRISHLKRFKKRYPGRKACSGVSQGYCDGACVGKLPSGQYQDRVREAVEFLTIPLEGTPERKRHFLQVVKNERTQNFSGGWRTRNLLVRLLKESSLGGEKEAPYLIEEKAGQAGFRDIFLIQAGLLRKHWRLPPDTAEDDLKEETLALLQTSPERKKEEAELERLVIAEYLKRHKAHLRIIPLNLLAS
jgi:DNA polymerase-3 subunit epsilon